MSGQITQSAGAVAAAVGGFTAEYTNLSTTALIIIGVVLLALVVAFIMYIRSGSSEKEKKLADAREKLRLMKEIEELEGK